MTLATIGVTGIGRLNVLHVVLMGRVVTQRQPPLPLGTAARLDTPFPTTP